MESVTPEIRPNAWKDGLPPRVEKLRQNIASSIPCQPDTVDIRNDLENMPLKTLMFLYINWIDRFIPPRPRSVYYGDRFWNNAKALSHHNSIEQIADKVRDGEDLTEYLSKRVLKHGYHRDNPPNAEGKYKKQWKHKDLLLAASDIHHLHLYPADRSRDLLLFVKVERGSMLFVMIGTHEDIRSGKAISEGYRHTYSDGKFLLNDVKPVFRDEENRGLVESGISTALISNQGVHNGSAVTSSGDALHYRSHAGMICHIIYNVEECLRDRAYVSGLFADAGVNKPKSSKFFWGLKGGDLNLYEDVSKSCFILFKCRR